ncbi:MAG TPA: hypothetical protein VHJ37_10215 [Thermoleophilaceae bacterium]|jgi:hypothetical protein|nr:hypothetical protein [Thermoleophilaceae bacterium]
MSDSSPPREVDRRLDEHLDLLRTEPPKPSTALVPRVIRTARIQRMLRAPVKAVLTLATAVASGVAALFGGKSRW